MTTPSAPPDAQTGLGHSLPTIEQVAERAGVSKTTVSHVLTGRRPVAAATRARVQRVVDELGFRPSAIARSLIHAKSNTVALMVPDVTNPFYPSLARGLQEAVRSAGYLALLADSEGSATQERAFVDEALSRRVDGLVLSSFELTAADLQPALQAGLAIVSIGTHLAVPGVDVVSADDVQIGIDAVGHLAARGHTRIATIAGHPTVEPGRGRLQGYRRGLADLALATEEALVVEGDWTRRGGQAAMRDLLALPDPPSAVFCANDLMAVGALDAARSAGVDVPGRLAVLGVDDIDAAAMVSPALSTVRIPARDIGHAAGRLLLERIDGPAPRARRKVLVGHELIDRQSA